MKNFLSSMLILMSICVMFASGNPIIESSSYDHPNIEIFDFTVIDADYVNEDFVSPVDYVIASNYLLHYVGNMKNTNYLDEVFIISSINYTEYDTKQNLKEHINSRWPDIICINPTVPDPCITPFFKSDINKWNRYC